MSKKRKNKLLRGKFYSSYPTGGHPALIYRKNKRKNKYDAIVFGTTIGKHKTRLKKPISNTVKQSVVQNRPIRGVRKDFSDKELTNLKLDKQDKPLIKIIEKRKPLKTKNYKNKQK